MDILLNGLKIVAESHIPHLTDILNGMWLAIGTDVWSFAKQYLPWVASVVYAIIVLPKGRISRGTQKEASNDKRIPQPPTQKESEVDLAPLLATIALLMKSAERERASKERWKARAVRAEKQIKPERPDVQ